MKALTTCLAAMAISVLSGCRGTDETGLTAPSSVGVGSRIVYVTQDETPWSSLGRLDVELGSRSFFTFSKISDSERVRWNRETGGGILTFSKTDGSYFTEQLPIFAPYGKQPNWRWKGLNCSAAPQSSKILTTCVFERTGAVFSSLYSPERGVEWFEESCDHGPGDKCQYVLQSPVGLLAESWLRRPH